MIFHDWETFEVISRLHRTYLTTIWEHFFWFDLVHVFSSIPYKDLLSYSYLLSLIISLPFSQADSCRWWIFKWVSEKRKTSEFQAILLQVSWCCIKTCKKSWGTKDYVFLTSRTYKQHIHTRPLCQNFRALVSQPLCTSCVPLVNLWFQGDSLFVFCLFEGLLYLICGSYIVAYFLHVLQFWIMAASWLETTSP